MRNYGCKRFRGPYQTPSTSKTRTKSTIGNNNKGTNDKKIFFPPTKLPPARIGSVFKYE